VLRDRIKELRRVPASEIQADPRNWREHPTEQRAAVSAVLAEIGMANAVLAREDSAGKLILIDGHLRSDIVGDGLIPVLVLDVDEAEAGKLLATLDPLAAMAQTNAGALDDLLRSVSTGSEALQKMLDDLKTSAPIDLSDPPESVEENAAELEDIKQQRRKGKDKVIEKTDTEKYIVIVYPSRAAKAEQLARLGLPADERYVAAAQVELRGRGALHPAQAADGRSLKSAKVDKSGATG
jgi:hypothetical protein